jgi:hypothetical protein
VAQAQQLTDEDAAGKWQVREPVDSDDRVEHEDSAFADGVQGWRLYGASRRGRSHAHEGKYRDDYFQMAVQGEWHIVAVADGAGSARLSRVGAHVAVEAAVSTLKDELSKFGQDADANSALRRALWHALDEARNKLSQVPCERSIELRDLATTLLLLVHRPADQHLVAVGQVGDGLIAGQDEGNAISVLGTPERGEYAGETQFLTHITGMKALEDRVAAPASLVQAPRLFLVMTDGVADDFDPPARELPRLIQHLPDALRQSDGGTASGLLNLLGYRKRGSFDDRTLVVLASPSFLDTLP